MEWWDDEIPMTMGWGDDDTPMTMKWWNTHDQHSQQAVTTPRPKGCEKEVGLLGPRRAQAVEEGPSRHVGTQPFQENATQDRRSHKAMSWPLPSRVLQTLAGLFTGQTHLEARGQGSPGDMIPRDQPPGLEQCREEWRMDQVGGEKGSITMWSKPFRNYNRRAFYFWAPSVVRNIQLFMGFFFSLKRKRRGVRVLSCAYLSYTTVFYHGIFLLNIPVLVC